MFEDNDDDIDDGELYRDHVQGFDEDVNHATLTIWLFIYINIFSFLSHTCFVYLDYMVVFIYRFVHFFHIHILYMP